MKSLPLLVCICALSASFSLSEGQKQQRKIYHKKNSVRQYILDHRSPFHPQFRPDRKLLIQKHFLFNQPRKPSNSIRKYYTLPEYLRPPKYPIKNNTVVNNNTSEATTQIPSVSPTSTSSKNVLSPGVIPFVQNATTTSARENNVTTGSSAATPAPQSSPAPPETTAAPTTSSPATTAPQTPSVSVETTDTPATVPPATPAPQSSPALSETPAAPTTSSSATPAPQPSPASLETTAAPNTTLNPSPTTLAPETSQTTAAPTTQTPTPATTQTTAVEQPTSSSPQNTLPQFWLAISKLWELFLHIIQQQ
ncbi:PREDICTED: mucin-7 [Ceratotherium simum simum]|uniref:Mucin-7 n=1 Tax=Ceratotherium simum simum TaxID=73337 RepID=A0ABM1CJY0_CERSS|nr:PREDICTED: mucin-7 [Ceratotherium simum simum]